MTEPRAMRQLPHAPSKLPPKLDESLHALAVSWAESTERPRIDALVLKHWDELIDSWLADASLPLYVRKSGRDLLRGRIVHHNTGRELVPADNSPAHWSFMSAYVEGRPTLAEVKVEIAADQIPVAMALSQTEKQSAHYRCCRGAIGNPNDYGWKLCHIHPVALKVRGPLSEVPMETIHRHFRDFISPSNMFLIPKSISGLGELPHFTEALSRFRDRP